MTEQAYLSDPYRRELEATVTRRLDDRVVLDRTHFYPEGGGQPPDHGRLRLADGDGEWRVTDVRKKDTVYHTVEPTDGTDDPAPPDGATVVGTLDWERRYGHMRHHTAQHLLSALLLEEYDAETTGNQVYADRARIDCAYDRFSGDDLDDVEARLNELIETAMPVRWYGMDRDRAEAELDTDRTRIDLLPDSIEEVRIVEIGGGSAVAGATGEAEAAADAYDRTACAGTHVENTEECGRAEVTGRETKGGDEERLSFRLVEP